MHGCRVCCFETICLEVLMPAGRGTYGRTVGRPPNKKKKKRKPPVKPKRKRRKK